MKVTMEFLSLQQDQKWNVEVLHYYVFVNNGRYVYYERTCSDSYWAEQRVQELEKRGLKAFWQTWLYPGFFY